MLKAATSTVRDKMMNMTTFCSLSAANRLRFNLHPVPPPERGAQPGQDGLLHLVRGKHIVHAHFQPRDAVPPGPGTSGPRAAPGRPWTRRNRTARSETFRSPGTPRTAGPDCPMGSPGRWATACESHRLCPPSAFWPVPTPSTTAGRPRVAGRVGQRLEQAVGEQPVEPPAGKGGFLVHAAHHAAGYALGGVEHGLAHTGTASTAFTPGTAATSGINSR